MSHADRRYPRVSYASDSSLLVTFGDAVRREHHRDVRRLFVLLQAAAIPGLRNLHPAYASLLVGFDPLQISDTALAAQVQACLGALEDAREPAPQRRIVPVCYGGDFGPDLETVASAHGLQVDDVIRLHASVEYLAYFIGFAPGFPYLGELPAALHTPRLATPRLRVPAGSVAIGGAHTGIYPIASPGGWHIIGRTPVELLRLRADPPVWVQMGDRVRFEPISRSEFEAWKAAPA